ncbi:acetyltransferase [Flavobacterium sp. 316]|nr:acetyltransferase [Flavobacterium sp. 316]
MFNSLEENYFSQKYKRYRERYKINSDFRFNGLYINFYGEGELICGSNSYIGNFSTIQINKGCKVSIGNNCAISHNVRIYTESYEADQDFNQIQDKAFYKGNVIIGDGVWIGANVLINPNVTIGDNVVIGANSVVTKDLMPFSVYGGVPAKLIRSKSK